jgi:hypothetical protein
MVEKPYVTELTCRRCGGIKLVHKYAEPISFWFCHRADDKRWCLTMNRGNADPRTIANACR